MKKIFIIKINFSDRCKAREIIKNSEVDFTINDFSEQYITTDNLSKITELFGNNISYMNVFEGIII
jgi:arsenate reductase-like glutaredoxin family protein